MLRSLPRRSGRGSRRLTNRLCAGSGRGSRRTTNRPCAGSGGRRSRPTANHLCAGLCLPCGRLSPHRRMGRKANHLCAGPRLPNGRLSPHRGTGRTTNHLRAGRGGARGRLSPHRGVGKPLRPQEPHPAEWPRRSGSWANLGRESFGPWLRRIFGRSARGGHAFARGPDWRRLAGSFRPPGRLGVSATGHLQIKGSAGAAAQAWLLTAAGMKCFNNLHPIH